MKTSPKVRTQVHHYNGAEYDLGTPKGLALALVHQAVDSWKRLQKAGVTVDSQGQIVTWPKPRIAHMNRDEAQMEIDFLTRRARRIIIRHAPLIDPDAAISRLGLPIIGP